MPCVESTLLNPFRIFKLFSTESFQGAAAVNAQPDIDIGRNDLKAQYKYIPGIEPGLFCG
jgi:hypothetical protein